MTSSSSPSSSPSTPTLRFPTSAPASMRRARSQQLTPGPTAPRAATTTPSGRRQQPARKCKPRYSPDRSVQLESAAPSPSHSGTYSSHHGSGTDLHQRPFSGFKILRDHTNWRYEAGENSGGGESDRQLEDVEDLHIEDPELKGEDMEGKDIEDSDIEGQSSSADLEDSASDGFHCRTKHAVFLFLLLGVLLQGIRQCCVALFPLTPLLLTSPLPQQCLQSSSDFPLLPAGARAPLSAMAMTLALYPDYSLTWVLEQTPITEPHIDSPVLLTAARDLTRAVRSDYGYTRTPDQGKLVDWWWDRLIQPSTHTTPIAENVKGALAVRSTPLWKRAGLRVMCATVPSWDLQRCAGLPFFSDPINTGFLPTSLTIIARRACLQPDIQLNVTRSRTASRQLQAHVHAAVQDIADRASSDFSNHVRHMSRAERSLLPKSLDLPPTVQAPWSSPDASSTRRQRVYLLRKASTIAGVQIPSKADQQKLHALAALYAKALFFDFVATFIESLNYAVQDRCHFALNVTSSLETAAFDGLLRYVLNNQPVLDADPLVYALLNMTHSTFQRLEYHADQHSDTAFPLLQPLQPLAAASSDLDTDNGDNDVESDDSLEDRRPAKTFIGGSAPDLGGNEGRSPRKASLRTIFDKAWKTYALAEARIWGKVRSDGASTGGARPAWLQCLATSSSSASDNSSWFSNKDGSAQALATQAVWAFWQTGASPDWYTYDHPSTRGQGGRTAMRGKGGEKSRSQLYPPQSSELEAMILGALEVDMEHAFGWGLDVD